MVSILVGLALATATGFRIFIPMLFLSIGSLTGFIDLSPNMEWLGTDTALIVLGIGTVFELLSYLIPGVDNIMDMIDTPIAVIAGILVMFSVVQTDNPMTHWIIAIIIGGAIPAILKAFKATIRGALTAFTGGFGNIFLAILEAVASIIVAVTAIFFLA
ncbi:DUF4126 domain-containing protein [Bacillus sp. M6-12]|uniref:DUF4126 domain-containing protein n=1 Tax=Bacillus sp. M6-12 TaxID=2054166 RepID=UPI000C75F3FA|nr:DUF4126 domain-containing protein [Bacillus sp. M6-12]PLS18856.1 DUF4126 domain-containing protein [Bacillus sp. M6-12]